VLPPRPSDPYNLKEVGYYIPKPTASSHAEGTSGGGQDAAAEGPIVIQINDVDVDHRGLAFVSDRVGAGLFVLEYTGPRAETN
jgi:hypothetical protein